MTDTNPAKRLRKETPEQVKQKIEQALLDINTGNTTNAITFSSEEFDEFSLGFIRK